MSVWPEERVRDEVEAAGGRSEVAVEALRSAFGVRTPTPQAYDNVQKWLEGVGVGVEPPLADIGDRQPVTLYLLDHQDIAMGVRRSTAEALRRGDRGALTGFFESRQAAVVAYCSAICQPSRIAEAVEAAFADLFTMLRSNGAVEDADLDEALLRSTRAAAAERAASGDEGSPLGALQSVWGRSSACQIMPRLLAARANAALSPSDRDRVERHIRRCGSCRALARRFEEADNAFRALRSSAGAAYVERSLIDRFVDGAEAQEQFAFDWPQAPQAAAEAPPAPPEVEPQAPPAEPAAPPTEPEPEPPPAEPEAPPAEPETLPPDLGEAPPPEATEALEPSANGGAAPVAEPPPTPPGPVAEPPPPEPPPVAVPPLPPPEPALVGEAPAPPVVKRPPPPSRRPPAPVAPPPARPERRAWPAVQRFLTAVLFVTGVLLVAEATVTTLWKEPLSAFLASRSQKDLNKEFKALERKRVDVKAQEQRALARVRNGRRRAERKMYYLSRTMARETADGRALARIEIPRLKADYVVVQGAQDESALRKGPGHYRNTVLPGDRGTVGIAGHRTTYNAPFRHIDNLKAGNDIIVTMPYGRFTYQVIYNKIVDPGRSSEFATRESNGVLLTACHPPYSAAKRIIVFAKLVNKEPLGVAADELHKGRFHAGDKPSRKSRTEIEFARIGRSELGPGDKGKKVKALQRMLGIKPEGIYGPKTTEAVRAFQAKKGLPTTGYFGKLTRRALRKAGPQPPPTPPNVAPEKPPGERGRGGQGRGAGTGGQGTGQSGTGQSGNGRSGTGQSGSP